MAIDLQQSARDAAAHIANRPSSLVKQEAAQIKRALQAEAARNVTGAAAAVVRGIDARLNRALPTIQKLERSLEQHPEGDHLRKQVLARTIDQLLQQIAMDCVRLKIQLSAMPGTFQRIEQKLPRWLRKQIHVAERRGGLPIAGGGLRPFNLSNTTGVRREPNFEGEVIPHHALPEREREGLRPDGLDWVYTW